MRDKQKGALKLGLDILCQLDCSFPAQKYSIIFKTCKGIAWAKRNCKFRTLDELERIPILVDPEKIEVMHLLDRCSTAGYVAGNALVPLLILKRVRLSLKHGLCVYSPPAFADLGLLHAGVLKDFEGAAKIAEYTLKMLEHLKCRNTTARTLFVLNCFVLPWVKPALTLYKVRRGLLFLLAGYFLLASKCMC